MTDSGSIQLGRGLTLLLGGARSGKSDLAVSLGQAYPGNVVFAATAEAHDDDMEERIRRHQLERPPEWAVLEEPLLGASMLDSVDPSAMLIVDCITLLVTNLIFADKTNEQIEQHASILSHALVSRRSPSIVISNEVGLGIVPDNELGRRFRDVLGRYNARLCSRAETALLVAAGRATRLETVSLDIGH